MAEYRRSEIVSGLLFILLSILVFIWFFLKARGVPIPFVENAGVECEAVFWDVGPLDEAAKVTAGGHRIGTVTGISGKDVVITPEEIDSIGESRPAGLQAGREHRVIRVTFKITDPTVRLGEDATVSVLQDGFIGSFFVSVDPGTWDPAHPPPLVGDRKERPIRIKPARVETLKDLIPALKPIVNRVDSILVRIDRDLLKPLLDGKTEAIGKIVPELQAALSDVHSGVNEARKLLDASNEQSPVRHFNKLMDDTNASVTDVKNKITAEVLEPLKLAIEDGKAAAKAAKTTLENASQVLDENRPNIKKMLDSLRSESEALKGRLDDVQTKLGKFLDSADALASLQQSDVAVVMETLRNTTWELEQLIRKVRANPAVVIWGDDESNRVEADPRDDSGLRKSGRVKPYEKRDETPAKKE
jgi:ABC-type transporter Mla subunit MlaD